MHITLFNVTETRKSYQIQILVVIWAASASPDVARNFAWHFGQGENQEYNSCLTVHFKTSFAHIPFLRGPTGAATIGLHSQNGLILSHKKLDVVRLS
jgi:hypothetical protein